MKQSLNSFSRMMGGVLFLCFVAGCGSAGDGVGTRAALVSLQVMPSNPNIELGTTKQLSATGVYSDGTRLDLTVSATWSSSTSTIATVSNTAGSKGLVTPVSSGSTSITAKLGSMSGSTNLTVPAILVSIQVTPTDPSIAFGTTKQLTATGIYSDNTNRDITASVTWSSSDPTVAAVSNTTGSNGLATSVAVGSAVITAVSGTIPGSTTLTITSASLVSIEVTPSNPSMARGSSQQFTATGIFTDNTVQDLTTQVAWDSSLPDVATIDPSSGLASAAAVGSTLINATLLGKTGSTALTVTSATLQAIDITPVIPNIVLGTTQQFTAIGTYSDNTTEDLTAAVTWDSSNTSVATISDASGSSGLATSVGTGLTTITATLGAVSVSTDLTVDSAVLVSIDVAPTNPVIPMGLPQQFSASGNYSDGSVQDLTLLATWKSSDTAIAAVSNAAGSNGQVTPVSTGQATITASVGGISGNSELTVNSATLTAITITPATPQIALGTTLQFVATGTYSDSSTQDITSFVTWNSSDNSIAMVSNAGNTKGLATTVGAGTTDITAALGSVYNVVPVTLTVTTATLQTITITPVNSTIFLGTFQQFTAIGSFSDSSSQDLTTQVTWRSSNKTIAAISNAFGSNGLATPIKAGSTTISATFSKSGVTVTGATVLTVSSATLLSITIAPINPSLAVKKTLQFTATGHYGGGLIQDLTASRNLTWSSSNNAVATIINVPKKNKGLATGASAGTVTIKATISKGTGIGTSGTTILTVK